jgi:hypothetical protein
VAGWISEKNTFGGAWGEFVGTNRGDVDVAETTEHAHVIIGGMCTVKSEVWGLSTEGCCGTEIEKMSGSVEGLGPKIGRHGGLEEKGVDKIIDGANGLFGFTVLLRSVGAGKNEKGFHGIGRMSLV